MVPGFGAGLLRSRYPPSPSNKGLWAYGLSECARVTFYSCGISPNLDVAPHAGVKIQPGMTAVDCGANVGMSAFSPSPNSFGTNLADIEFER